MRPLVLPAALLGGAGLLLVSACGTPSCVLLACGSGPTTVFLRDDGGAPVIARGERRARWGDDLLPVQEFDCRPGANVGSEPCVDGTFTMHVTYLSPDLTVELRFARPDGTFTPWQPIPLLLEPHTDPDFAGPDCPCTWYEAEPATVIVPAEARLP